MATIRISKNEIVHTLARHFGFRRYLELRTQFTGPDCEVDTGIFETSINMRYQSPLSPLGDLREDCFAVGLGANSIEIALLDPWHSYQQTLDDLADVFARLTPGGAIVCHDCWPPQAYCTVGGWRLVPQGAHWSGETYMAFMDFVCRRTDIDYLIVDDDCGCGIILKRPGAAPVAELSAAWEQAHSYDWLENEGRELLRLTSPAAFVQAFPPLATKSDLTPALDALVVVCVHPDAPFCLQLDAAPSFRLGYFDYTGSGFVPPQASPADLRFSAKVPGKGALMAHLAKQSLGDYDYLAVIDHDIEISVAAINQLLLVARAYQLDLFQPGLSADSYSSHPHLLVRPQSALRETTLVECMMPFFSRRAFDCVSQYFHESQSGWGLDYLWSHKIRQDHGKLAVIDCVVAKHLNPISSQHWNFANGETAMDEMTRILAHYQLTNYVLK